MNFGIYVHYSPDRSGWLRDALGRLQGFPTLDLAERAIALRGWTLSVEASVRSVTAYAAYLPRELPRHFRERRT